MPHTLSLEFSLAQDADIPQAVALINAAYRGESSRLGWTTEADLLAGLRTDEEDMLRLLQQEDSHLLLCRTDACLLGTVHLQYAGEQAQIGMLAVRPSAQGQGVGKQLLMAAEAHACQTWPVKRLVMAVIPARRELIEFYQRRGYRRTGIHKPFPLNPALWAPKVEGLSLEILEKPI